MKDAIILIGLLIISIGLFGQKKLDLFFDEFCISINKSNVHDENTVDKLGYGLGIYHSFRSEKKMNIIFGWEYNRLSQFKKYEYTGHFSHRTDVTYITRYLSFPLGCRLNIGTKLKLLIETGGFADLKTGGKYFGTSHSYFPDENNNITYHKSQFEERGGLPSTAGVYCEIGFVIPISSINLTIKSGYRTGLSTSTGYTDFQNRYFRLSIGLKIY